MTDLYEVIRTASSRPPRDAAFYLLFEMKLGDIRENLTETMKMSHPEIGDAEIAQAIGDASKLSTYCNAVSTDPDVDKKLELGALTERFPYFSYETYLLASRYISTSEIKESRRQERRENKKVWLKAPAYLALAVAFLRLLDVLTRGHG